MTTEQSTQLQAVSASRSRHDPPVPPSSHQRVFLVGVGGFTLASLLCGVSQSVEMLIGARVLQAVFAAAIGPAGLALIRVAFPAHALPRALGVFGAVTAAALASGPVLGGALMSLGSWHLVFLVNLPFGLLAVLVGVRVLRQSASRSHDRLDLLGAITLVASMVAVIWGVTAVQQHGWTALPLGSLLAGLVLLAAFVVVETRVRRPMVPLALFRRPVRPPGSPPVVTVLAAAVLALFIRSERQDHAAGG